MMGRTHFRGLCCLLENTGGIPKTAPAAGARGGGHRLGWNEVQILIIWNLIQVIPILEQLAAHILVHLCRGIPGGVSGFQLPITVRVEGHQVFIWTLTKSSIALIKLH